MVHSEGNGMMRKRRSGKLRGFFEPIRFGNQKIIAAPSSIVQQRLSYVVHPL
jgi:hypothetical protein